MFSSFYPCGSCASIYKDAKNGHFLANYFKIVSKKGKTGKIRVHLLTIAKNECILIPS